jgi:drug/metabolite transporter (DMT)-like permease
MNILKAILLKLTSALFFAMMAALVRYLGTRYPVGQVVFFRSAFAIVPVVAMLAVRNELMAAVRTGRPLGHLGRGSIAVFAMFLNFAAFARLPLVDATAISFAAPLITVAFAAIFLGEHVRIYRWSAVVVGFAGVLVMLWPYLDYRHFTGANTAGAIGSICALVAAFGNSAAVIQTRRLMGLGLCGGLAHIFLTESYRFAPASVIAPFDYTAMVWAFVLGFVMFGELPTVSVYIGSVIVAGAGIYVIWRERQLGLQRRREIEGPRAGV